MDKFLGRRELFCFCVVGANHKMPRKKDFAVERSVFPDDNTEETHWILPNGEIHHLVGVSKGPRSGTATRTTYYEYEYKRGVPHGKYYAMKGYEETYSEVEGEFHNGKPHGSFRLYYEDFFAQGCVFVDGKVIESSLESISKETTIFCRNKNSEKEHHITRSIEFRLSPFVIYVEEEEVINSCIVGAREREFYGEKDTAPVIRNMEQRPLDCRDPSEIWFFSRGHPK